MRKASFSLKLTKLAVLNALSGQQSKGGNAALQNAVVSLLKARGADAHVYMPGPGVPILGPEIMDYSKLAYGQGVTVDASSKTVTFDGSQPDWGGPTWINGGVSGTSGKMYQLSYTVVRTTGSVKVSVGPEGYESTPGLITKQQVGGGGNIQLQSYAAPTKFVGSIVGLSIREILGYTNYLNGFAAGNYIESTGNTNASVDGAVGLVLDAAGSVGSELMPAGTAGAVIGAPGALPNGWQGGVTVNGITRQVVGIGSNYVDLRLTGTATSTWADYVGVIGTTISVTPGETYRIEMPETTVVGGTMPSGGGITYGCATQLSGTFVGTQMGRSQHITIPTGVNQLRLFNTIANYANGATVDVTLRVYSTVSVKKVTGTHATQATTANKPTLRRGIVNLLTYSNDFTNAIWVKGGGNFVGDTFTATGTAQFYQTVSVTPGMTYTFAFKCRKVDMTTQNLAFYDNTAAVFIQDNVSYISRISNSELSIVTATVTVPAGCTSMRVYPLRNSGWTGESAKFESAGLFQGTLTAQQIIAAGGIPLTTTAPASSQYGIGEAAYGAELAPVTSSLSGWSANAYGTLTTDGTSVTVRNNAAAEGHAIFGSTVAGKQYSVSVNIAALTNTGAGAALIVGGTRVQLGVVGGATGVKTAVVTALDSSGIRFGTNTGNLNDYVTFNAVSAKEITGYKSLPNSFAWQFDGSNDALALPGPLFQMADDHFVLVAAARGYGAGGYKAPFFPAGNLSTTARAGVIGIDPTGNINGYYTNDAGSFFVPTLGTVAYGEAFVATMANRSGSVNGRKNGGNLSNTVNPSGACTLNAAGVGTAQGFSYFDGMLFLAISIKGTVSAAEERALTKWAGSIAGVPIA